MVDPDRLSELFSQFRPELNEVASRLAEECRRTAPYKHPDPRAVFARAWNASLEDRSLADERHRENLQRKWCWLQALLRIGNEFRREVASFVDRHLGDERLQQSDLLVESPEGAAERIERGMVGLADEIEDRMPERALDENRGRVRIDWRQEPGSWLEGLCIWEGEEKSPSLGLCRATRTSFREGAELPRRESEVWADLLLHELREGKIGLPDFQRLEGDARYTFLLWQPKEIEPLPREEAPGEGEKLPEAEACSAPLPIELELWDRYPKVAEVITEALSQAVVEDYRGEFQKREQATPHGQALPGVGEVVLALQRLTGRPTHEVVLLLIPLLERRLESSEYGPGANGYLLALDFLWGQISQEGPAAG